MHPGDHVTSSLYDRLGPERLRALVEAFYPRVKAHPLLGPLFPDDLGPVMERQEAFLTGYTGGPPLFHQRFGHQALRARHARFPITPDRARAWLECMALAAEDAGLPPAERRELLEGLSRAAAALVNTPGPRAGARGW